MGKVGTLVYLPGASHRLRLIQGTSAQGTDERGMVITMQVHGDSPEEVARATAETDGPMGDAADQAEHLSMVMEAEAIHNALNGGGGEGSLDGLDYPLEDPEATLAMEDAEDGSDDPMHAGGLTPRPWVPAEESAMHTVDDFDPEADAYLDDETDEERADPNFDQFDEPVEHLTPEDETLMGVDPYE